MAKIFITGSADGLGQIAANMLVKQGHNVVLHARNAERGQQTLDKVPGAEKVLIGDLSSIEETKNLAMQVNALDRFDAIIHNAGIYHQESNGENSEGIPSILVVNTLAPYILTCLIQKPERLIYLSSGLHLNGDPSLESLIHISSHTSDSRVYSDSKLNDVILCMAVARKWPEVYSNAVNPGWVPTKMGGHNAPDNLVEGAETQAWLAVSNDKSAKVSGHYFFHRQEKHYLPEAGNTEIQDKFLALCEKISGVHFPAN